MKRALVWLIRWTNKRHFIIQLLVVMVVSIISLPFTTMFKSLGRKWDAIIEEELNSHG